MALFPLFESPAAYQTAALAILYFHFAVVVFNVFWLVAVPIGAWLEWRFVRNYRWRIAHIAALILVAAQAVAGRLCFLTIMQDYLQGRAGGQIGPPSLLTRIVTRAIYWPLPDWVFAPLYVLALVFAVLLWIFVPPRRTHRMV
jgi:hypothetical protein